MLGLVIRVVEAQISLSIDVMRKSAEFAGRVTGWAFNEVASGFAPERPRPAATGPEPEPLGPTAAVETQLSAPEREPIAPEPVAAVVEPEPPAVEPEPEPLAPATELVTPAPTESEAAIVEAESEPATSEPARTPHSALNNPITEPDPTEWPDPYDHREDPRDPGDEMVFGGDAGHTPPGAISTSEPHPSQDPEAEPAEGPKRDKVDR